MFPVPTADESILMIGAPNFLTLAVTFMSLRTALISKLNDYKVISMATSLVPLSFSTQNLTPISATKERL